MFQRAAQDVPHVSFPAYQPALSFPEDQRLLTTSRLRACVMIVALGTVGGLLLRPRHGFEFIDAWLSVQAILCAVLWGWLTLRSRLQNPLPLSLAFACAMAGSLGVQMAHLGSEVRTVSLLSYVLLNFGSAVLLPWGPQAQSILAAASVLSVAWASHATFGSFRGLPPDLASILVFAFGFSIYVAYELDRARRALNSEWTARAQAEENLSRALELAQSASRAKSEFLASVSHEIRTPINAIIGMDTLLMDTRLDGEQREFAEHIRQGGEYLLALINDILDFSKIEAGRVELERQKFDLYECVESSLDVLAAGAAAKGLELLCDIDSSVPNFAYGDPTRLRQILVNLLANAVKFTAEGEVVVSVRASKTEDHAPPRLRLEMSVRDTGIGVTDEQRGKLFHAFSQGDRAIAREFGGTGLGLVISKRLAELMGGTLTVESGGAGQGSTFTASVVLETAPEESTNRVAPDLLAGRSLLVVEDHLAAREILARTARAWGFTVREAGLAHTAAEVVRSGFRPDIAVIDGDLPGTEAAVLARELRELCGETHARLVLMTTPFVQSRREPSALFDDILFKPVKKSAYFSVLCRLLLGEPRETPPDVTRWQFDRELGRRNPLRILLAEDNRVNQVVVVQMLRRMGYEPDVVANGLEVLDAMQRKRYDLLLLDVVMPEKDGLETARDIRSGWPTQEQPFIVALTANVSESDRQECLSAGMDGFLSKPIRAQQLEELLIRVGNARHGDRRASPDGRSH